MNTMSRHHVAPPGEAAFESAMMIGNGCSVQLDQRTKSLSDLTASTMRDPGSPGMGGQARLMRAVMPRTQDAAWLRREGGGGGRLGGA